MESTAPEGSERLASSQENTRNAQNTPLQVGGAISHIGLMVQWHIFLDLEKDFSLRDSASSFHWLSSSIFSCSLLSSRIGDISSHLHNMMFQSIQTIVQMTRWLYWQDDEMTRWPDDLITSWSDDQMTKGPYDQRSRWPEDLMTRWPWWIPIVQMTRWPHWPNDQNTILNRWPDGQRTRWQDDHIDQMTIRTDDQIWQSPWYWILTMISHDFNIYHNSLGMWSISCQKNIKK